MGGNTAKQRALKEMREKVEAEMLAGVDEIYVPEAPGGWDALKVMVGSCRKCALEETRTNAVFGEGNVDADLMFIGEAPGGDEDKQGRPFVGRAGQLLTKIIEAIGMKREDVFIANILKCRPPGNRNPLPE